jgi:UTRA domain
LCSEAGGSTIRTSVEGASGLIAERLAVSEGTPVVVRKRVRFIDGEPFNINDTYPTLELAAGTAVLNPADIPEGSNSVTEKVIGPEARAVDEIYVRMPTPDETRRLKLSLTPTAFPQPDRPAHRGQHLRRRWPQTLNTTSPRRTQRPHRCRLAVLLCWQFQANPRASQGNHPNLRHTDVSGDLRRMDGKVLGGLARQQVDLDPRRRPDPRRHHPGTVHRLAATGAFGAYQSTPRQTVLNSSDKQLNAGPRSVLNPCRGQPRPPGTSRDETTPASSARLSNDGNVLARKRTFIASDSSYLVFCGS